MGVIIENANDENRRPNKLFQKYLKLSKAAQSERDNDGGLIRSEDVPGCSFKIADSRFVGLTALSKNNGIRQ